MAEVRERSILMDDETVRAVLDGLDRDNLPGRGRKWQARTPISVPASIIGPSVGFTVFTPPRHLSIRDPMGGETFVRCPYGRVGDRLYVREAFAGGQRGTSYMYRADDRAGNDFVVWRRSTHMPRSASRITLEVTRLRVEHVQDITEEDARAEGAERPVLSRAGFGRIPKGNQCVRGSYVGGFRVAWSRKHPGVAWETNPVVCVAEFNVIEARRG